MDLKHYRNRAVYIHLRDQSGSFPGDTDLRPFLKTFGWLCDLRRFRIIDGESVNGLPNAAIVSFTSLGAVERIFKSSRSEAGHGTFWHTHSVTADLFRPGSPLDQFFASRVFPKLRSKFREESSDSEGSSQSDQGQSADSDPEESPQAKRPRTNTWAGTSNVSAIGNLASTSRLTQASNAVPESSEWMRARIAQLEVELENARATHDMSTLEQELRQAARQEEQRALREAVTQKSAAEAALSRQEAERIWLHSKLEEGQAREAALLNDADNLRRYLAEAEEKLRFLQSTVDESASLNGRVKALETELEEAGDRAQKIQLHNSRLEDQIAHPDTTELDQAKAKVNQLESEVKRQKWELVASHEELESTKQILESTQKSLESIEEKSSSAREECERTKAKLGVYKSRLENERMITQKMKDALTPELYRSLGATYETLGAFLSINREPATSDEGDARLKGESD